MLGTTQSAGYQGAWGPNGPTSGQANAYHQAKQWQGSGTGTGALGPNSVFNPSSPTSGSKMPQSPGAQPPVMGGVNMLQPGDRKSVV